MAIRNIYTEHEEVLRKKSRVVIDFNKKLFDLLDDMAETMYKANGVGLAAPQVGMLKRAVIIDVGEGLIELINPEIIETSGKQENEEGCLSLPGQYGNVVRPAVVKVEAQDRNGDVFVVEGTELLARALCHEIDHLNGVLFKDLATDMVEVEPQK